MFSALYNLRQFYKTFKTFMLTLCVKYTHKYWVNVGDC